MEQAVVSIKELHKVYNRGKSNAFEALRGISLTINKGEMVAVVGKSGAGKSTLLHVLACIDSYESGEYRLGDRIVRGLSEKVLAQLRNEKIGMVMQDFALIDDFTALDNVMIPLSFAKTKPQGGRKRAAMSALEKVGITELAHKPSNQLSGGQKQRVAIARAIANSPELILADEPTGALDSKTSEEIITLLKSLNAEGKTVIIVTHEADVAAQCQRVITLSDGCVVGM